MSVSNLQFNKANPQNQVSQLQQSPVAWPQQQHLQQLLQNPNSQQQQQRQMQHQELHQLSQQQQQQQVQQQQPHQQQRQLQQQQQQQQQICHPALVNNGVVTPNQIPNQSLQQPVAYSQLQQQQILTSNTQSQQSINSSSKSSLHMASLPLAEYHSSLYFHHSSLKNGETHGEKFVWIYFQVLFTSLNYLIFE